MKYLKKLLFLLLLCVGGIQLVAQEKYEIRAVWLTTLSGLDFPKVKAKDEMSIRKQKQETITLLDDLKNARFNLVFLQTRIRADVIYPSQIEPFADAYTGRTGGDPGYDPLAFFIEEAHKRSIECHAWIVAIPLGSEQQIKRHGVKSLPYRQKEMCVLFDRQWFMNPAHPQTSIYLAQLAKEIVSLYDIDGIHLDYIRYPENSSLFPDRDLYKRSKTTLSLPNWRRENINRIVYTVYDTVKNIKPWVLVSSSPLGRHSDYGGYSSWGWNGYHTVYQDAKAWFKAGKHDMIAPMMYAKDRLYYPFVTDWQKNSCGRHVLPGLAVYFLDKKEKDWPMKYLSDQVLYNRMMHTAGTAYFRYLYLKENHKNFYQWLRQSVYTTTALIPPARWLDSIPPLRPIALQWKFEPGKSVLTWKKNKSEKDPLPLLYNIYASPTLPVDTNDPSLLIASGQRETTFEIPYSLLRSENMFFVVTAVDKFKNESLPCEPIRWGGKRKV